MPGHEANDFNFAPILEVAWLFLGIFGTMVPALDYLQLHARQLGLDTSMKFFWFTSALSAVLDNAPTYLTFLAAGIGRQGLSLNQPAQVLEFAGAHDHELMAISLGAVFFGAATYIGNGPNFMVKSICEQAKVSTPPFVEYVVQYAFPILHRFSGWWRCCFSPVGRCLSPMGNPPALLEDPRSLTGVRTVVGSATFPPTGRDSRERSL